MDRIRKHRIFLRRLLRHRSNRSRRNKDIEGATKSEVCAICEIVKNLVHNEHLNIHPSDRSQRLLKKHRRLVEKLIARKVNSDSKRRILQKGAGGFLLPLLLGLVGPVVNRLLA